MKRYYEETKSNQRKLRKHYGKTIFFGIHFLFGKQIITYMAVKENEYLIYCDFKIILDCYGCYVFVFITLFSTHEDGT